MKKNKFVRVSLFIVVAAALAMYFIIEFADRLPFGLGSAASMTFMATGGIVEFDANSNAHFYAPGGRGYFFITKDGISFRNENGVALMSESFTMQNPQIITRGNIVGVAETGGFNFFVYNAGGLLYRKDYHHPIVNFTVNEQGLSCVVTKRGDDYYSFTYNQNGALIYERLESPGLIAISAAISRDGRILAMAYLDISGVQLNSIITFTYLNASEGARYTDFIYASLRGENIPELKNQFFGIMRFMDGNNLVVFTGGSVFSVSESQPSRPAWVITFNNYIDAVDFSGSHIALAKGRGLINMPSEPAGRIVLLNRDGERVWIYDTFQRVQNLRLSPHGAIIGDGRVFTAVNLRGQILWDYEAEYDAKGMQFMDTNDKILLNTGTTAQVMRRVRIRGGNQGE
jgi:hypothetical protein